MIVLFGKKLQVGDIVAYSSQGVGLRFAIVTNLLDDNSARVLPNDTIDTNKPNRVSVKISATNLLKLEPEQIPRELFDNLWNAYKHTKYQKGPKYSPKLRKNRRDWAVKFKIPKHGIRYRPLIKIEKVGNPAYDLLSSHKKLADACFIGNNMVKDIEKSSFSVLGIFNDEICRIYDAEGELIEYNWYTLAKFRKVFEKLLNETNNRYLEQYDIKELRKQAENATYLDDIASYYNVKPSEMKDILESFDISSKNRLDLS